MSRHSVFGSLLGLVFLVNFGRVAFAPLLAPLGEAFAVGEGTLGVVATLAWVGSALPRIPAGYLLTHVSRARVVLGSGLVLTVAAALTATAGDVPGVMVGAFLVGLASGTYFVAANPLVSELFPDRVGTALGVHGTAAQTAAVVAAPLVLLALSVGTWRTAVQGLAVVAAVSTLTFSLAARRTEMPNAGTTDRDLLGAVRHQWRVVLAGVVVVGATGLVWNGVFNFYVTYLVGEGVPSDRANLLLTVAFAAGIPAMLITGRVADRVPEVPLSLAVAGGFTGGVFLLGVVDGFVGRVLVSVLLGYAFYSVLPAVDAYLLGSLPDHHRASAYAVYSGTMTLLQAAGAATVGRLASAGVAFESVFAGLAWVLTAVLVVLGVLYRGGRVPTGART